MRERLLPGARHEGCRDRNGPLGLRALVRSLPRSVLAVTALFALTLVVWTVLMPPGRSADEINHVDAGIYLAETHEWPGFKNMPMLTDRAAPERLGMVDTALDMNYPPLSVDVAPAHGGPTSFAETRTGPHGVNSIAQHPPLYYGLLALVHAAAPESIPLASEVWLMRLVSVVLLASLPLVSAALAATWGASRPVVVGAAWVPLTVPQLAVLGGAVNNDNLLTASSAWVFLGTALIARGDHRARTAAWTGAALAVALLSKAFGLLLLPLVAVVLVRAVAERRARHRRQTLWAAATLIGLSALGAWWWVASIVRFGTLQPSGHAKVLPDGPLPLEEGLIPVLTGMTTVFPVRFWAFLSIKGDDDAFPPALSIGLTGILLVLTATMLARRRVCLTDRWVRWAFVSPLLLTLLVLTSQVLRLYLATGALRGLHGRYLFFAVLPVLLLVVMASPVLTGGQERRVAAAVVTFGLGFTAWSALRALSYHWGTSRSTELPSGDLRAVVAWSPLPSSVTVSIALMALASVAVALALTARDLQEVGPAHREPGGRVSSTGSVRAVPSSPTELEDTAPVQTELSETRDASRPPPRG